jgi:hypothetical protein
MFNFGRELVLNNPSTSGAVATPALPPPPPPPQLERESTAPVGRLQQSAVHAAPGTSASASLHSSHPAGSHRCSLRHPPHSVQVVATSSKYKFSSWLDPSSLEVYSWGT